MKPRIRPAKGALLLLALIVLLSGCDVFGFLPDKDGDSNPIPDTAGAVRLLAPDDTQPPFVTEFYRNYIPQDGRYAGIIFLRETDCVPEDFNLLNQPPIPGEAFGCALTIEAATYWYDPETDPFPFYEVRRGDGAVPVWFVKWPELQKAIADDELTIGELEQLPSLMKGFAGEYDAEIVNSTNREGIPPYSEQLAKGRLTDGRRFYFYFTERFVEGVNVITDIKIKFY